MVSRRLRVVRSSPLQGAATPRPTQVELEPCLVHISIAQLRRVNSHPDALGGLSGAKDAEVSYFPFVSEMGKVSVAVAICVSLS
jgi:hypothetical protein